MKRTPLRRSGPIKKRRRTKSEALRIYGPPERRAWMKTLPCSACGVVGYSEGAHVLGNDGMGRKAGYETQAPLCGQHPSGLRVGNYYTAGCHYLFDQKRWVFNERYPDFNPERVATETEKLWRDTLEGTNNGK